MANPTYQSGFYAPGRGTAKYPELWDGCVGAWNPGLGNTGLSLRDWSGNQNNGTLTNGPTWDVSGGQQALSFDGVNDYVSATPSLNGLSQFSLSMWVKAGSASDGYFSYGISSSYTTDIFLYANAGVLNIQVNNGTDGAGTVAYTPNASVWRYITVVFDGGQTGNIARLKMFVDGVQQILAYGYTVPAVTASPVSPVAWIGHYKSSPTSPWPLLGHITDTRVYNRALSLNEIRTLAQRPGVAYELAPRKFYSLPAAASSRQYRLFRPSILRGA